MTAALVESIRKRPNLYLVSLIITLFLFPTAAFNLDVLGIDPSWSLAINMAVKQNLVFGKDWIFTFGPLGYLFTRNPYGIDPWPIFLYDLFVAANVYFVVYKHLLKLKSNREWWVCILILLLVRGAWESFLLFYLLLFHLFYALQEKKPLHLFVALLLSLLLFYIKLNLGLVAIICFWFFLLFALASKRFSLVYIAGAALLHGLLIWLSAKALNVWLPGYVKGGIHLINAYNDAMAITDMHYRYLIMGIVLLMVALFGWPLLKYSREFKAPMHLLLYSMVGLALFLLVKTSFVRAHWTMFGEFHIHASVIFIYASLFVSLLYYFSATGTVFNHYFKRYQVVVLISSVIGLNLLIIGYGTNTFVSAKLSLYQKNYLEQHYPELKAHNVQQYFPQLLQDTPRLMANSLLYLLPYQYLQDVVTSGRQEAVAKIASQKRKLPERFLQQISHASVDILPFEISFIYFNGLHYKPRPVIQSYSAYDAWLDSVNAASYASRSGPDYLLFQNQSIDGRYPFWDETKTKLAILQHYAVTDSALLPDEVQKTILLQKRKEPLPITKTKFLAGKVIALNDTIHIPHTEDILLLYADIEYNWWGKLRRLFYQPPALEVSIIDENNRARRYKAIVPILQGGVICNYFVPRTNAAYHLFTRDRRNSRYIRKIVLKGVNTGFVPSVNIRFEQYRIGE